MAATVTPFAKPQGVPPIFNLTHGAIYTDTRKLDLDAAFLDLSWFDDWLRASKAD